MDHQDHRTQKSGRKTGVVEVGVVMANSTQGSTQHRGQYSCRMGTEIAGEGGDLHMVTDKGEPLLCNLWKEGGEVHLSNNRRKEGQYGNQGWEGVGPASRGQRS